MTTLVIGCSRCGEDHQVEWKQFSRPPIADPPVTHWGMCPKTNEPVLMYIEAEHS